MSSFYKSDAYRESLYDGAIGTVGNDGPVAYIHKNTLTGEYGDVNL
jgi:hypothetical protein